MTRTNLKPVTILLADDDEEDRILTRDALRKSRFAHKLFCVEDGEELMDYLLHQGSFTNPHFSPVPDLILLDLNMPRKNGPEALQEIKADPKLRHIPVVVLTTSQAEEDIYRSYELGANSFMCKPVTFEGLVEAVRSLFNYWFELVELPLVEVDEHNSR